MKKLLLITLSLVAFNCFADSVSDYADQYRASHQVCTTQCSGIGDGNQCYTTCT